MRKVLIVLLTVLIASLHASAATPPTLSIENFTIKAGETKELLVDLNNPDDQIANVQFLLNLPTGLTVAQKDGKSLITLTNRASGGHQVMDNPSSGMVMVYSMPVAAFSGTSGAILSISLTAGTGFAGGNVALRSIVLATEQGGQYKPDDVVYTIENKVPVTGITLNATSQELNAGQTFQLSATVAPSNATNKSVKWSSSKSSVATVSSTGLVTAVAAGSAVITCEAEDGSGVKATCNITVKAATVAVTGITLNATSKELTAGQTFQLSATVAPSNATNKNMTWNSNKTSVATVSSNGLVTAVAAGSAVITCEAQDGSGVKATCNITVKAATVAVTGITLNATSKELTTGQTFQLSATVAPSNATNKNVTWNSNKTSVATVSSNGLVTAVAAGSAVITCEAQDGSGVKATCNITVKTSPTTITVALDESSKVSLYWFATATNYSGGSKDEIHVNAPIPGLAGSNIYKWTYDVFSTFISGRPKLTVTGADAVSVTPLLSFRSVGNLRTNSNGDALLCDADTIAKVNVETGNVTMVMSESTKLLLNLAASDDYVDALTLPLCVKARYNGVIYNVTGGDFTAKVIRPVNAVDKELANQDITSGAATLNLGELVNLTDWRNYSINTRGLFDFYDIESITVMGATNSSNVGSAIMASVNGSWVSVSSATDKLTFTYQPKSLSANAAGAMPDYGTLTIANNGFSGDMQLLIPVTVSYAWGEVQASAYVTLEAANLQPELQLLEIIINGDGIVGTKHTYRVRVQNIGNGDFNGSLYVWVDNERFNSARRLGVPGYGTIKAGKIIWFDYTDDVDDGEEDTFFVVWPGAFYFWVTTDAEGQNMLGEKTAFVFTPAATLTAKNYTREYGEENPDFGFTADKGGFSGTPKISCTADRYSDVGTYPIIIEQGSVDNNYVTLVPGTLTITKAPLTVSAGSWLNREGWEPAGITPKYENFKNGENKSVLTKEPQFTTTATAESPMGSVHQLTFSGAEAKNYAFNYIPGTITIIGRPGDVNRDSYINTTDAVDVIQYILGYNSLQDIFDGDLYRDDQITISDVASVIDYIMANDRAATRRTAPLPATTSSMLGLTLDEQGRLAVTLRNDRTFTGFQFDVTLPGGAELSQVLLSELRRNGHSVAMRHMDDGSYRVLVYSMQNNTLHGSDGTLATLLTSAVDGDVTLSNIHFADADCVDHQLPDVSLTMLTGISTLTEGAGTFDIYDLNGRLVRRNATSTKGLHRGIYMINNQKVVIK